MENEEKLDSSFNDYENNQSPIYSNDINNIINYSSIYNSRDYFSILGLSYNKILIAKESLDKIFSMIDIIPEEYISFRTYEENEKITSLYLFQKENNNLLDEKENNEYIATTNYEDNKNNDIDDGFKKVENLEDSLFNPEIYKRCFCFYLFLIFCSIWDFIFYIYIVVVTEYKSHFYTIYTLILTLLFLFTGIFGLLKCKNKDFSGHILKIGTFLVPILIIIGIIIYSASDIDLSLYWVKIIIDIVTMVVSVILIAFITGLIKAEIIQFNNNSNNKNQINQNLINETNNNEIKEQNDVVFKF